MHEIAARNVNEAWPSGMRLLRQYGSSRTGRGGEIVELNAPVATIYRKPLERVLFCYARDANPFFHLFESLWILAGRNDVDFPAQFAKQLRNYSDDGTTFHAAYGFRLRHEPDQIRAVIRELKKNPGSRRAVAAIWSPCLDLGVDSEDIPCNTHLYFKIDHHGQLRLTVCNRSNDIIWGLYGANAVQWSTIQEYVANSLGVPVGALTTVSDSFHAYTSNPTWKLLQEGVWTLLGVDPYESYREPYGQVAPYPLMDIPAQFDTDLHRFLADPNDDLAEMFPRRTAYCNSFFWKVAEPMYRAWERHKFNNAGTIILQEANREAREAQEKQIDWLVAGEQWLARREAPVREQAAHVSQ